jgi:hypothetical protein
MSETDILTLIDAEIAELQQARALIAATGKNATGTAKVCCNSDCQTEEEEAEADSRRPCQTRGSGEEALGGTEEGGG